MAQAGRDALLQYCRFAGLPLWYRARRQAHRIIYSMLPRRWQEVLDKREQRSPFFGLTQKQLEKIMLSKRFTDFRLTSHVCQSTLWSGRHLECRAVKSGRSSAMIEWPHDKLEPQAALPSA